MWWDEGSGGGRRRRRKRRPSGTNPYIYFPAYVFGLYIFFGCGGNGVMLMFTYFGFWNSDFEVMIDDSFVRCYVGDELIISL